jgi:hypothetical protein
VQCIPLTSLPPPLVTIEPSIRRLHGITIRVKRLMHGPSPLSVCRTESFRQCSHDHGLVGADVDRKEQRQSPLGVVRDVIIRMPHHSPPPTTPRPGTRPPHYRRPAHHTTPLRQPPTRWCVGRASISRGEFRRETAEAWGTTPLPPSTHPRFASSWCGHLSALASANEPTRYPVIADCRQMLP